MLLQTEGLVEVDA